MHQIAGQWPTQVQTHGRGSGRASTLSSHRSGPSCKELLTGAEHQHTWPSTNTAALSRAAERRRGPDCAAPASDQLLWTGLVAATPTCTPFWALRHPLPHSEAVGCIPHGDVQDSRSDAQHTTHSSIGSSVVGRSRRGGGGRLRAGGVGGCHARLPQAQHCGHQGATLFQFLGFRVQP